MRNKLLNLLKGLIGLIISLYIFICVILYFTQEKLIFAPQKLENNYTFNFQQDFEELNIKTTDGKSLHGLLFKSDSTKGLIFYLHGNGGSVKSWGNIAKTYTNLNYDIFILDYRSYGKSEGDIENQQQLFEDNQVAYDELMKKYNEQNIIILGSSIGTGMASKLASENKPKQLILLSPYYNFPDLVKGLISPIFPTFILKYKFATNEYLKTCGMPITIFHGNKDNLIPYESSLKLKAEFENKTNLIMLEGEGHNFYDSEKFKEEMGRILNK